MYEQASSHRIQPVQRSGVIRRTFIGTPHRRSQPCLATGSSGRFDGEKLPVPYGDETRGEIGIGFDESDEWCHLLRVRRRVIDNQQSTRPQHALQVWPPAGILRALGIKEDQVERSIASTFEHASSVVLYQRDGGSQAGTAEVLS